MQNKYSLLILFKMQAKVLSAFCRPKILDYIFESFKLISDWCNIRKKIHTGKENVNATKFPYNPKTKFSYLFVDLPIKCRECGINIKPILQSLEA